MGKLEDVLLNFGKGTATGIVKIADPVGFVLSDLDREITGAGYSSERAPNTLHNLAYKLVYKNPEESVDTATGYVPRAVGTFFGAGLTAAGLYGLYSTSGLIAALALPAAAGVYSLASFVARYVKDFSQGEPAGEKHEKASFYDGFRYGWHSGTHFYMPLLHSIEGNLTGRGFDNSKLESSIKESSTAMRRNFSAIAGVFLGSVVGTIASVASLFILPIYKSVRDTMRTLEGEKVQTLKPAYVY